MTVFKKNSPLTCQIPISPCFQRIFRSFVFGDTLSNFQLIFVVAMLSRADSTLAANAHKKLACLQTTRQKKLKWAGRLRPCFPHAFSFPLHPPPVSRRVPERARAKGVSHSHSCPTQEDQEYNAREGSLLYAVRRLNTIALLYAVSTL